MSKAIITMEDIDGGIDVRLEFDPPTSVGVRISGAQWLAGEMLKVASKILEQAQQEPVGFMNAGHVHDMQQGRLPYGYVYPKRKAGTSVAIYTTPPQRPLRSDIKPLTDEEIEDIWADCPADWDDKINVLTLARAIEAAHGIKE